MPVIPAFERLTQVDFMFKVNLGYKQTSGQSGLHEKTLSQKNKTKQKKKRGKEGGREGEKEGGKEEDSNGAWNWKPSKPGVPSLRTLPISASS
jgi:hypothetical protein